MFINKYLSIINTFVVIFVLLSSMDLHAHCPEKFIETTSKTFGMKICIGDQIEKQYITAGSKQFKIATRFAPI